MRSLFASLSSRAFVSPRAFASTDGNISLFTAFLLLPIAGAIGLAVDYGSMVRIQSGLQSALDGAVLAAARERSARPDSVEAVFADYVAENFTTKLNAGTPTASVSVDADGVVSGTASITYPTSVMQLFGIGTKTIDVASSASFGASRAEIALVLDNTASMAGAKLDTLRTASKQLIDTVYAAPGSDQKVKVGIVPFAQYVNVGTGYRGASWLSVANDATTTTTQCWDTYPASTVTCTPSPATCYNDGVPYSCTTSTCTGSYGAPVQQCGPVTTTTQWNGCVGSRAYPLDTGTSAGFSTRVPGIMDASCTSPLTRLTNVRANLTTQIDAMVATGETFIAPGLAWGWRVVSHTAPFADGTDPAANSDVKKIIVLMTDGANTKSPNYPDHWGSDTVEANRLTAETCASLKAAGASIYVVALDVTDSAAAAMLSACSSGPPYFYSAATTSQLADAFDAIGKSLVAVHLTR